MSLEMFIMKCLKYDNSPDMCKIIDSKVKKHYHACNAAYTSSETFKKLLQTRMELIDKDPKNLYVYIKEIVDELKLRHQKGPLRKKIKLDTDSSESSNLEKPTEEVKTVKEESQFQERAARKLSKMLHCLQRKIMKLEQKEVDWDDENDSTYIQLQRYKERAVAVYKKLQQYECGVIPKLQEKRTVSYSGTAFPSVNRAIEKYVNKTGQFPDYQEVLKLLKSAYEQQKMNVTPERLRNQAAVAAQWVLGPCTLQTSANCSDAVLFYLFHSERPDEPLELRVEDGSQRLEGVFDPRRPTKVIVHGYVGGVDFNVTKMVRQAYLRAGGLNVLVVDWGRLAPSPCYLSAVINTIHAGRCLAAVLMHLQRVQGGGGDPLDVHMVGHSLGAHISAFASNYLHEATGSKVRRITGLDPALPFFATLKPSWKLDPSDADFVDAIHTNAGVFGKIEASGHADFYVNGGTHQPACREARNEPVCSHLMSAVYFAESVESAAGFWGIPCPSYWQHALGWCPDGEQARRQAVPMGERCPTGTRGVFLVETAEASPFALGNQPTTTTTTAGTEEVTQS